MSKKMSYLVLALNLIVKTVVPTYVFPNLTAFLDNSVLFSTPINSYKTLKEGWYLLNRLGLNPYDSMINHPPILLQILSAIDMENDLVVNVCYALVDTMLLWSIWRLCSTLELAKQDITWFYTLNPLITLATFSKNTILFTNLFIVLSLTNLVSPTKKNYTRALIQLAFASYLSYFPIYLIIPYINHIYRTTNLLPYKYLAVFITTLLLLIANSCSFDLMKVLNNCYISVIKFEKIQPNLGLWWYFFIEIFDFFHDFYIGVFNMYSFVFIIPFTYRLGENPVFNLMISVLWINFTKNYPTIGDLNLSAILILTMGHQYLNKLRIPILLSAIVLTVLLTLLVLFFYLWVNLSSGNSNFFYGVGLVYNMLIAWTLCDLIWAELQRDWFERNGIEESKRAGVKLTQF